MHGDTIMGCDSEKDYYIREREKEQRWELERWEKVLEKLKRLRWDDMPHKLEPRVEMTHQTLVEMATARIAVLRYELQ
jgi:hypothetical protein